MIRTQVVAGRGGHFLVGSVALLTAKSERSGIPVKSVGQYVRSPLE